jgi:ABC-type nitrate/sulfonate/bicarbonate transport system permease component
MTLLRRGQLKEHGDSRLRWQKLLRIASPFLLLLLWEALSRFGILDRRFFPPPSEVLGTARQMLQDGSPRPTISTSSGYTASLGTG